MHKVRVYTCVEIDGRKHVATAVPPPPGVADWVVLISRSDGTEPVMVCEKAGVVHCTCRAGQTGNHCVHLLALKKWGAVREVEVGLLGGFRQMLGGATRKFEPALLALPAHAAS